MGSVGGGRRRRHRALYWTCVGLAVIALVGGTVVALVSYAATGGPAGAVRGYFAALERSDAPAALGYGDIPAGPRDYLTRAVLREQQRIAPMSDVHVTSTSRSGANATVSVTYRLQFGTGVAQFGDQVSVRERHGSWRLANVAAVTQLGLSQAEDRARILGTPVPSGSVLLFPGALPITFDTSYLQLAAGTSSLQLQSPVDAPLTVEASPQGRAAVLTALRTAFAPCVTGGPTADPRCPLPDDRGVPDSLRGAVVGAFAPDAKITVESTPAGRIDVSGHVQVHGSYQDLDFNDLPVTHSGTVSVPIAASTYPTPPLRLAWQVQP